MTFVEWVRLDGRTARLMPPHITGLLLASTLFRVFGQKHEEIDLGRHSAKCFQLYFGVIGERYWLVLVVLLRISGWNGSHWKGNCHTSMSLRQEISIIATKLVCNLNLCILLLCLSSIFELLVRLLSFDCQVSFIT